MGRGKKWSSLEDQELAAAYAALTSAGLKTGNTFWERVHARFHETRSIRALQNRWVFISEEVKEFVNCLDLDESEEEEVVDRAMELFRERKSREFEFLHCWRILQHCPKFGGDTSDLEMATKVESMAFEAEIPAPSEPTEVQPESKTLNPSVEVQSEAKTKEAGLQTTTVTEESLKPLATATQQQLTSELRRKNDLQEDELAMKLFGETPESAQSQRYFELLKRKKVLLLEQEVDELEQAQQKRRQRTA
ncbi:Glutathione S-transferase T3-like [Phytophthora palmivora]|uniref:Glutathione S-transferase T3-like n=1 Tax=Phytophthora palmivora TaxID=4796 RepID=A0A2P4YKH9_9STRA|nr:Glutathione S-transferase T3-like [Phytophthora palmivora]